jgi:hypothetical protein
VVATEASSWGTTFGAAGAERLAGVLGQCTALARLDLRANDIGTVGEGRLRASCRGQGSGLLLEDEECSNEDEDEDEEDEEVLVLEA